MSETIDLGIVSDAVDHGALETRLFRPDRLVFVVARNHRLAKRHAVARSFAGLAAPARQLAEALA